MLCRVSELCRCSLQAEDGQVGAVADVFFSDLDWAIRYFVVDTGFWRRSGRVLISPLSLIELQPGEKKVTARLTRQQVETSPDIDTAKPVSRHYEVELSRHYALPMYWAGGGLWGSMPAPHELVSDAEASTEEEMPSETVHLRSSHELRGYRFEGEDGEIGHIKDSVLDDQVWLIRYLEIDTRNWWPGGKKVLLARQWINQVSWEERKVKADVHRSTVRQAPPYDESRPITEDYEIELFKHYGRELSSGS